MSDRRDPLIGLWGALDVVVVEMDAAEDGVCRVLTEAPDWAAALLGGAAAQNGLHRLAGVSPFLDSFLDEATATWSSEHHPTVRSGPWIEVATDGPARDSDGGDSNAGADRELALEAIAVLQDGRRLLVLRRLGEEFESRVEILQRAREHRLEQESLEAEVERRTADLRRTEEEIAVRLMMATAVRDRETGAHVRRIGLYAAVVAGALGWDRQRIDDIRVAATMHDIGKIGVPDLILLKPGKLTTDERTLMEHHTQYGARLLDSDDISILRMARDIALAHHEHWDGGGYPLGLRGSEIPDGARVVAVVDVYDAMTHARPYKDAMSEHDVLAHLEEGSGRQFDPAVVAAFRSSIDEIRRIRAEVLDDEPSPDS